MKRGLFLLIISMAFLLTATAFIPPSGSVGIRTRTPQATLDVNGEIKIGHLASSIPYYDGMIYYDTTDQVFYFRQNTEWIPLVRWIPGSGLILSSDTLDVVLPTLYSEDGSLTVMRLVDGDNLGQLLLENFVRLDFSGSQVGFYNNQTNEGIYADSSLRVVTASVRSGIADSGYVLMLMDTLGGVEFVPFTAPPLDGFTTLYSGDDTIVVARYVSGANEFGGNTGELFFRNFETFQVDEAHHIRLLSKEGAGLQVIQTTVPGRRVSLVYDSTDTSPAFILDATGTRIVTENVGSGTAIVGQVLTLVDTTGTVEFSDAGSGNNFANADLTFDSNRVHDLNGFSLSIEGATNRVRFGSTDINGTGAQGWFSVGLDALEGTGTLSNARFFRTASTSYLGASVIGDLAPIGMTPATYLRYLGDSNFGGGSGRAFMIERVMIDTLSDGITFARGLFPGANPSGNVEALFQYGNGITGDSVSVLHGVYAKGIGITRIHNYSGSGVSEILVNAETNDTTSGVMGQLNFRIGDVQKNEYKKVMVSEGGLLFFDDAIPFDNPYTAGISYEPPQIGEVLAADGDSGIYRPTPLVDLIGDVGLWIDQGQVKIGHEIDDTVHFLGYYELDTFVVDSLTSAPIVYLDGFMNVTSGDLAGWKVRIDGFNYWFLDTISGAIIRTNLYEGKSLAGSFESYTMRADADTTFAGPELNIEAYQWLRQNGTEIGVSATAIDNFGEADAYTYYNYYDAGGIMRPRLTIRSMFQDTGGIFMYSQIELDEDAIRIVPDYNTPIMPGSILTSTDTLGNAVWVGSCIGTDSLALADSSLVPWDLSTYEVQEVTLTANATLQTPTGGCDGESYELFIWQDGVGSHTLSYGADYLFPGGVTPTLTGTAGSVDILTCIWRDRTAKMYCVMQKDFQ